MPKFLIFILISLFLHSMVLLFDIPKNKIEKPKYIPVSYIKNSSFKYKQIELKNEKEKEVLKEKEESQEELSGQIVDLPPDDNSSKPEEADFLSETNHKTERETVSRHSSLTNEQSGHEKTQSNDIKNSSNSLGTDAETQDELRKKELPEIDKRDKLALKKDESGNLKNDTGSDELKGNGESLHLGQHDKDAEQRKNGARKINLFPDQRTLARITSVPFADSIEDVEEGEGTFLNTFAFKYATFFNRVKRDVASMWKPMPLLRHRDPTGEIYGHRNRKTLLSITLDSQGYIKSVTIIASCGVDFLDNEAVTSFWRVQQFPNPPKGMIKNGQIQFNFGFDISFNRRKILF